MPRKPNRQKTYDEVVKPHKQEIHCDYDTGVYLHLDLTNIMKTYKEMLAGFYRANEGLQPIVFQKVNDIGSAIETKDWYAVMYRGWHVRIFEGPNLPGPHSAQLWYKNSDGKNFWIATVQLMAFFYNGDEVKQSLLTAIEEQEFFLSEHDSLCQLMP